MEFHSMKRKQLQALCKKHKIPANLSNLEMANKLTEFLKEKEDPVIRRAIKGQDENNASETESADVVVNRKVKKVRFSPEHELIEFTRSREMKRRSRRNSTLSRNSSLSADNVDSGEMNNENVGRQGRVTRSRGSKSMEAEVNEKKRGTNAAKRNDRKNNASAVEIFGNGKEGDVDSLGRGILLRRKNVVEGAKNGSKRERKRAKGDDDRDEKALDDIKNEKLIEETADNLGRVTRSRAQKLTEASAREGKMGTKVVKSTGNVASVRAETDENRVAGMSSSVNGGDVGEEKLANDSGEKVKKNEKGWQEILKNKKISGDRDVVEPQIFLRRSKRNANRAADSEILNVDTREHENGEGKGLGKKSKLLASYGSGVTGESNGIEVNLGKRVVLKNEEPIKVEPRRSSRRKNVIESDEVRAETENRDPLRRSVQQLGVAGEVSKDKKKVLKPTGVMRRSRHKTLSLKLASADNEIDADSAVKNLDAEKHIIEKECSAVQKNTRRSTRNTSKCKSPRVLHEIGGDSIIHRKNEVKKRKRGPISGADVTKTNNDPTSVARTKKESSNKKAVPAAATGKVADERKETCRLSDPKILDASSHNGLEIGELFFMDAQQTEITSNAAFGTDTSAKKLISAVGLTSSRKTHRKKPGISIADSAGRHGMKLINGKVLASSDTNAASRITESKTDSTDFEDQISASNIRDVDNDHSLLEFDAPESIEPNITDMVKNDPEVQVFSQMEGSGCNNKIDNKVLPEGSNVSGKEGFAETGSSADSPFNVTTVLEVAVTQADKCLLPSPRLVDDVGEVEGISAQENLDSDENSQDNQVLPECSNVSGNKGFAETGSSADSLLLGDQTDIKMVEAEADKCLHPSSRVVHDVGEVKGIPVKGNLDYVETRQDSQVLPEGSNISGKEGFAETDSSSDSLLLGDQTDVKTDPEVAEAEADRCLQRSPNVADHFGEVKGISVKENLDSDEMGTDNQVLPEGSNVSATEGFAETSSSADSKTDLEVAEAEADTRLHPSPSVVDRVAEVKGTFLQEKLGSDETRKPNDIHTPILYHHIDVNHLEASSNILDNNNEDTSRKAGAFESCERHNDYTHSKSTLELKAPSSGMLRRLVGDSMADGNEAFFHMGIVSEQAGTNEDGYLNNQNSASYQYTEFGMSDQSDGARSAGIVPQDRVFFSGGHSVINSDEQGKYKDSLVVAPMTICTNSTESNLERGHKADPIPKKEEIYIEKGIISEDGETAEDGSSKSHKNQCDGDVEFDVSKLFDAEGRPGMTPQDKEIISGEFSTKDFADQEMFDGSPCVAPTTIYKCARDNEMDLIAEGDKAYIYKDKQSELIEADKSGCLSRHKSSQEEDWEFSIPNLFDGEKSAGITPQDTVPAKDSINDFNEQVIFPDFPSQSTANCNEVEFCADSSNLQEISPSKPNCVSGSQAEQSKSPLAKTTAVANTIQSQEASSDAIETTGSAMCLLNEEEISKVVEGSCSNEDANDANCGKDKEDFDGTCSKDVKISTDCTISKTGVESLSDVKFQGTEGMEQQSKDLLAGQTESVAGEEPNIVESRQSWTEFELENLFGANLDDDTAGLNDASSQVTEIANLTLSANKSIANNGGSLTKKKEKEMEGERSSEYVGTTSKNVVLLTTNYEEVSHTGSNADKEENQLNLLLETPIKIVSPCKMDESYSHGKKLDRTSMSIMECFDQNKSDEKVRDPLPDNGDVTCEELIEVESAGLVNTSTTDLSEAVNDCCEVSEEHLTEDTGNCLKETNSITEEDKEENVIPQGQSCLYDEETDNDTELKEKNIIRSSASPKNLDKPEGCENMLKDTDFSESLCRSRVYHKSEREMTRSGEAAFELSHADLQKSNVPENNGCLIGCAEDRSVSREASTESLSGPLDAEVAKIGSFQKDLIHKDTSPHLSPMASPDHDEVIERKDSMSDDLHGAKIWDERHGTPESSQDISDAPHNLCQEADKLPSSLELKSTCKEAIETGTTTQNVDNIVAAAGHGSSVCGAVSGVLSSSALHLHPGDLENGDIEKLEAGAPVFNTEDDHEERNDEETENNSTANTVQFSMQELHFEEKLEDFNNCIQTISDVHDSGCSEILKESDVADTIKEYIDSESSLSVVFENSIASLPVNLLALTEERTACAVLHKYEDDIAGRPANSEGEDDKPSVDCIDIENRELEEAALFSEPVPGSGKAAKSPACDDTLPEGTAVRPLVETKGSAVKLDSKNQTESEDAHRSSSKESRSTAKMNARTVLIHGTPGKLLSMADMKENTPTRKSSNIGDLTIVRSAKRRALQDVQWR